MNNLEPGDVVYCEIQDQILISEGDYDESDTNVYYLEVFNGESVRFLGSELKLPESNLPYKISYTINKSAITLISKGEFK